MALEPAMIPPESAQRFEEKSNEIHLFWENLNFRVPTKEQDDASELLEDKPQEANPAPSGAEPIRMKTIVSKLTGVARPKEIVGLLGPSGSGKTVLMNIFSDRLHPPTGAVYDRNVYINKGVPLTRDVFGKIGAYVMQDDVLLETLTPYECLMFSANLRLTGTQEEKEKRVTKVIADLKLHNCMNTLVFF